MVDDLCIASETKEEHRVHCCSVLTSLARRHHCIKASKMHILRKVIEYLGHLSTPTGTMPTSKHVDAILHMPPPLGNDGLVDRSKLRSMIGLPEPVCLSLTDMVTLLLRREYGYYGCYSWVVRPR